MFTKRFLKSPLIMDIAALRKTYDQGTLLEGNVPSNPLELFAKWFEEAKDTEREANAMCLATATPDGRPSSRMVLLKGYDACGFRFFTNYRSRKSQELDANPFASLCFYWNERSVRIEGEVSRLPEAESVEYFATRPSGSQMGAWSSPFQSSVVPGGREELNEIEKQVQSRFANEQIIPKPDFWGGYIVAPTRIEFWQGRPSRLHDRILYAKQSEGWTILRLSP